VATVREKRPGVWEVRAFTGRDERGRPTQVSRTVHGTKRDAQRAAAEMTLRPSKSARRTVGDLLDLWAEQHEPRLGAVDPAGSGLPSIVSADRSRFPKTARKATHRLSSVTAGPPAEEGPRGTRPRRIPNRERRTARSRRW
jgi:hypothetical protein